MRDTDRYLPLATLREAIKQIVVYEYFDTTLKSDLRKPILATSGVRLSPDGGNLTQIINTIKINHKPDYKKIVSSLNEVNSNFTGFDFNLIGPNVELMLEESNLTKSLHMSNMSDGTLRFLCLLAILCNPKRGKLICIDEPEIGLHPDMVLHVANALKEASSDTKFVIATHSVSLLDNFNFENLLIFEKDNGNSTKTHKVSESQFEGWYKEFSLGKMWMAGDLGGVRYGN